MEPNNEIKNEVKTKSVQTYADEMAKVIEYGKGGLVKKIIHDHEEEEEEKARLSPVSTMNKLFSALSIVLIFASLVLWHYFGPLNAHLSFVDITPAFEPLVFTDE